MGIHQSLLDSPHKGAVMQTFDIFLDANLNLGLYSLSSEM